MKIRRGPAKKGREKLLVKIRRGIFSTNVMAVIVYVIFLLVFFFDIN